MRKYCERQEDLCCTLATTALISELGHISELQEKKADGLCLSCTDNGWLGVHILIIQELDLYDHLD